MKATRIPRGYILANILVRSIIPVLPEELFAPAHSDQMAFLVRYSIDRMEKI